MAADVRLSVRLTPRGGTDRVEGVRDGLLLVRVAAPPIDGAANEALVRLLARELDLPRASIRLVAGASGRRKVVALQGQGALAALRRRWPELGGG